jgi:pSer/pThr/pTyr-binding forkhead associated (FHA) protein/tetratricopeptide (TPR) repeat protein
VKLIVLKNSVPINEVWVDTQDQSESYEIFVGRSEDCHLIIDDPLISRHHLVLRNEGILWTCERLSKLGSVSINGQVSEKLPVQNNDEIKCGIYSILISDITIKLAAPVPAPTFEPEPRYTVPAPTYKAPEEEIFLKDETSSTPIDDLSEDFESPLESESQEMPQDSESSSDFSMDNDEPAEEANFGESSELVAASEFEDEASGSDQDEKTKFDHFFVNYMLRLFGEHAPYDRYNITDDETFIGRDIKKCQIILDDPEVSSVHAVLRKNNNIVTLEDLNSSNGTILNGERINRASVVPGDEFVIGGTSFSFEVKSELLSAERDRLLPVESNQVIETEEIEEEEVSLEDNPELGFDSSVVVEKSFIKRIWKNPRQRLYLIAACIILPILLFVDDGSEVPVETKKVEKKIEVVKETTKKLSAELEQRRNVAYELGVSYFEQSKYSEALEQFKVVAEIDPAYKKNATYLAQTTSTLKRLEELETQRREEEDRIKLKKMIEEIMVKAREAVKERQVQLAESYFSQITEKDPENIEVQQLKLELESWQQEEQRKALEKAAKDASRKAMVDALNPGKTFYLKKEWYAATLKLEEFLRRKGTDEDLIKEGSDMLSDAKNQLASALGPLLGKARSLKEGQDLRGAYEGFLEVLKLEPTNAEALNEVDDIRSQLEARSKKVYREAIIAESLSLFGDAKEKFQEVQQVSPTDSEYYKKATEKLKNYLE